jgi:hypothetical protein
MIRPAHAADLDAVSQLVHEAYGHYTARLGKQPGPMLDDYARRIANAEVWVLEDEGALAGTWCWRRPKAVLCSWTTLLSPQTPKAKGTDERLSRLPRLKLDGVVTPSSGSTRTC